MWKESFDHTYPRLPAKSTPCATVQPFLCVFISTEIN